MVLNARLYDCEGIRMEHWESVRSEPAAWLFKGRVSERLAIICGECGFTELTCKSCKDLRGVSAVERHGNRFIERGDDRFTERFVPHPHGIYMSCQKNRSRRFRAVPQVRTTGMLDEASSANMWLDLSH